MKKWLSVFIMMVFFSPCLTIKWAVVNPVDAMYTPQCQKATDLAAEFINNDVEMFPNAEVELVSVPVISSNTEADNLRILGETLLTSPGISGIVGVYSSSTVAYISILSMILNFPILAGGSTNPVFSNKEEYPFFSRVISPGSEAANAIGDFASYADMKRVAFVGVNNPFGKGPEEPLKTSLHNNDIQYIGSYGYGSYSSLATDELIAQMDSVIYELINDGAIAIVYNGETQEEIQLFIWRLYRIGVLGEPYNAQLMLVECLSGITTACPHDECRKDAPYIEAALRGTLCFVAEFGAEDEWFETIWKPATTPDKLTDEEISVSGSNDWVSDFDFWTTLSHDSALVLGKAQDQFCKLSVECYMNEKNHKKCNQVNQYSTLEECYANLPQNGKSIMEEIPGMEFEGATGNVVMNPKCDREMSQVIRQWIGKDFYHSGKWTPEKLRMDSSQPPLEFETNLIYSTGTGVSPSTVIKEGTSSVHKTIGYSAMLLALVVGIMFIVIILKNRQSSTSLKGKTFFTDGVVSRCIIACCVSVIIQVFRTMSLISPEHVAMSVIVEYICVLPNVVIFSGLASRMYRFNKITNNRKMRMVRFSKRHQLYTILFAALICTPAIIIRVMSNASHVKSSSEEENNLFDTIYNLQDEDPRYVFSLTQPVFDLYNNHTLITALSLLFNQVYCLLLALCVMVLSKMAASEQVRKTNRVLGNEIVVLEKGMALCAVALFVEVVICILSLVMSSEKVHSHTGFDNGDSKATLDGLRVLAFVQMMVAFACWMIFMTILFSVRMKKLIFKTFKTTNISSMDSSVTNTNTTTGVGYSHPLSDEMMVRLKQTQMTQSMKINVTNNTRRGGSSILFTKDSHCSTSSMEMFDQKENIKNKVKSRIISCEGGNIIKKTTPHMSMLMKASIGERSGCGSLMVPISNNAKTKRVISSTGQHIPTLKDENGKRRMSFSCESDLRRVITFNSVSLMDDGKDSPCMNKLQNSSETPSHDYTSERVASCSSGHFAFLNASEAIQRVKSGATATDTDTTTNVYSTLFGNGTASLCDTNGNVNDESETTDNETMISSKRPLNNNRRESAAQMEPVDPRRFASEMKKLTQPELKKRIDRFELDVKNYADTCARVLHNLANLDEKLDLEVLKLEVILVKSKRKGIKNFVYSPGRIQPTGGSTTTVY